jgi:maltooligosyltrehalose trehalohydrolase
MKITPGIRFKGQDAEIALWAPSASKAEIVLQDGARRLALRQAEAGYHLLCTPHLKRGDRYRIILNEDNGPLPDPASLFQPEGVFGPSRAVDLKSFDWKDDSWASPPLEDYVTYETHVGTFSAEGTFAAAEERLDYLTDLGITAVELMPVAQFSGSRGWGYDGVFPYAVQNSYGGPFALMHLVDACHRKGLAVILDVVYNHLGPEGNCLEQFGPYFTDAYKVVWGKAINFDGAGSDEVRNYYLQNALMWFRDFHIDALRIDASHDIKDWSPVHILAEMKQHTDELAAETGKPHYLIVELNLNDVRYIDPAEKRGFGMDAQWLDEFHHCLMVAATGAKIDFYADFNGIDHLAKSYRDAYVYDGVYSPQRMKTFGTKAAGHPGSRFVAFSQNHDQVANQSFGKRNGSLFSFRMQKLLCGAVLVSPYLPLFFMGEEWGATSPFFYFLDYANGKLMDAAARGRVEEFGENNEVPDPGDRRAFQQSKLSWDQRSEEGARMMLAFYKDMIGLRKRLAALRTADRTALDTRVDAGARVLTLQRWHGDQRVCSVMNFSSQPRKALLPAGYDWRKVLDSSGGGAAEGTVSAESIIVYANGDV